MLTQVRQHVTQRVHGHRGRLGNDSWAYRRLLLRGARHLSDKQWRRLRTLFATDDPTGQIQAAWVGEELLRQLLDPLPAVDGPLVVDPRRGPDPASRRPTAELRPYEVRARLARLYDLAAKADVPELTRLATTIETWWPAVEAYVRLRVTNARIEGFNREINQARVVRLPQPAVLRAAHHAQQRRDRGGTITVQSRPVTPPQRADKGRPRPRRASPRPPERAECLATRLGPGSSPSETALARAAVIQGRTVSSWDGRSGYADDSTKASSFSSVTWLSAAWRSAMS